MSAFFFAFLPYNIFFSRVILPEPAAVTFALTSLYLFSLWFDTNRKSWLFLAGFAFSLGLLIKPYVIFYSVPMFWLAIKKSDGDMKKLITNFDLWIFALIALLPVGLWRAWISQFPEGIPYYKWAFNFMGIRFRPAFWRWIFGERLGDLILGVWGLFPFLAGVLARGLKSETWFVHSFILGMFLYVTVVAAANVRHDYYQTLIVPAVVLMLARGVIYLWNTKELAQPLTRFVTIFSVFLALYLSFNDIKPFYQINHPEIIRAGTALDKIAAKDALVVGSQVLHQNEGHAAFGGDVVGQFNNYQLKILSS